MDRSGGLINYASGVGRIRPYLLLLLLLCKTIQATTGEETRAQRDAVRLNNIGTALMNQQLLEKALDKFDEAHRVDSSLNAA